MLTRHRQPAEVGRTLRKSTFIGIVHVSTGGASATQTQIPQQGSVHRHCPRARGSGTPRGSARFGDTALTPSNRSRARFARGSGTQHLHPPIDRARGSREVRGHSTYTLQSIAREVRARFGDTALDGSEAETLRIPVGPMAADADEPGKVGSLRPCSFSHQPGSPREISPRGAIYNIPISDNRLTLYAK